MSDLFLACDRAEPPHIILTGAFPGASPPVVYTQQAADFTAVANDIADGGTETGAYEVDASANPVVITLPANPGDCDRILIKVTNNTNQVSVAQPVAPITLRDVTGDLILSTAIFLNKNVLIQYDQDTQQWVATS